MYIHIYIYIYVYMYLLIYTSYMCVYLFKSRKVYISPAAAKLSLFSQWIPSYHAHAIIPDCRDILFQRYLERFLTHTPARFFLLPVEIFNLLVFVMLRYQQAWPHIMTHGLHINQHFIQAVLLYSSFCYTTLEAVCFTPFIVQNDSQLFRATSI